MGFQRSRWEAGQWKSESQAGVMFAEDHLVRRVQVAELPSGASRGDPDLLSDPPRKKKS